MNDLSKETILLNLIKQAVEAKGCEVTDIDFESRTIKISGADDDVGACARAVADIMDD